MLRRPRLVACHVTTVNGPLAVTTFRFASDATRETRGTFNETFQVLFGGQHESNRCGRSRLRLYSLVFGTSSNFREVSAQEGKKLPEVIMLGPMRSSGKSSSITSIIQRRIGALRAIRSRVLNVITPRNLLPKRPAIPR